MITGIIVFLIIISICASAFCSSAEIAFFSLPSSKIKAFKQDLNPRKRQIARLLQQPQSLIVTIFMLNTVVNIAIQNFSSDVFENDTHSWLLKVGVPLLLVLLFGELLPKYLGITYNEKIASLTAPVLDRIHVIITPVRNIAFNLASFFSRIFFFFLKPEPLLSKEEVAHILRSSSGEALIHKDEVRLILGFLSMEDTQVKMVMKPRSELPSYNIAEPFSKLYYLAKESHSQIAVFKETQDNIIGILDVACLFAHATTDISPLLRKPLYIPQTTTAQSALEQLHRSGRQIALIIDEYEAVGGFVSEAVFVQYITRLIPRHKIEEYTVIADNSIIADATLPVETVRELFKSPLFSKYHSTTIGGWLTEQLGTIPQSGSSFTFDHLLFRILASCPTHIKKIYIRKG